MVDPAKIQLTTEQRHRLAIFAEQSGKDWIELVDAWLSGIPSGPPASSSCTNVSATNGDRLRDRTLYDVLSERGILGCFDGPTDLSTNPKHMEGFGESRFPKSSH
jgi:hypothetical protein